MWRWNRVQRHNLVVFFFNSPWGCTFYFLIRILLGKWRWSWVQRQMVHVFFLIRLKIKKFTKRVAVRAVELSTGAFCTEFRCEQLCDDDFFLGPDPAVSYLLKQI